MQLRVAFVVSMLFCGRATADIAPCPSPNAGMVRRITAALVKRFEPSHRGAKAVVHAPACVPTNSADALYESGVGHGGWMRITSVVRDADEKGAAITRITVEDRQPPGVPTKITVERAHFAGDIEALLEEARLALHFSLEEISPPPKNGILIGGSWGSSADFYVRLDDEEFAGYRGGSDQRRYLPIQYGTALLDKAFEKLPYVKAAIDASARDLFVHAFERAQPTFDESFHWWVRELYFGAAGTIGTAHLAPTLTKWRDATVKEDDYSGVRTKGLAKRALEALGIK